MLQSDDGFSPAGSLQLQLAGFGDFAVSIAPKMQAVARIVCAIAFLGSGLAAEQHQHPTPIYAYASWSTPIKSGACSSSSNPLHIPIPATNGAGEANITCALLDHIKSYIFPAGVFQIDQQLLVPPNTSLTGAHNPNDMANPRRAPAWEEQTVFLATRGATDYDSDYCHALNMVTTRVGFVLSSHVTVRNLSYQGIDTIRPADNGGLCGGGAFETKGCAENNCEKSTVNNGGSDGMGSWHVKIENIRLNDLYFDEDKSKVGASIDGNYECAAGSQGCCFCKPNGIRTTQVGVWIPQTRDAAGTQHIFVNNIVSSSTQADGINLHGYVANTVVQNTYFRNTGEYRALS